MLLCRKSNGGLKTILVLVFFVVISLAGSCTKEVPSSPSFIPYRDWETTSQLKVATYDIIDFPHQSSAVFGEYAFFVSNGRSRICMYNIAKKKVLFTSEFKGEDVKTFHCNQSSFGVKKYVETDPFPLLYVSQRAKSDGRCFVEVFRILPVLDESKTEYVSFSVELVQKICFPVMTYENSLGNANCVIDVASDLMYTYSRNNNKLDDNYGICKISQFAIPSLDERTVYLEDVDIVDSFIVDCQAANMQGGCIHDGILYIGQGYNSVGYIYLNIIDLNKKKLVRRFDLMQFGVYWEPEGCFYYDGNVMLTHSAGICRIVKQ